MQDSQIEILIYDFIPLDTRHRYDEAEQWRGILGDFDCSLNNSKLATTPKTHFATEAEAREALEPHLRRWEAVVELERGIWFEFRFSHSRTIDRPAEGVDQDVVIGVTEKLGLAEEIAAVVGHGQYPNPPSLAFAETDMVKALRDRLRDIRTKRERLLVGTQWCLTRLEARYGGRSPAAKALNISNPVLNTLGRLGEVNDPQEGRKYKGDPRPLTEAERRWLLEALPKIITRVGQVEGGGSGLPQITMSDFSAL